MNFPKFSTLVVTFALAAGPSLAGPVYDTSFTYFARDNVGGTDNDIIRNTTGLTFNDGGEGSRFTLSLGVRNSFFDGDYPVDVQVEALRFRQWRTSTVGIGGRIGGFDGGEFSVEAMGYGIREWGDFTGRGVIGLQAVTGNDAFADGRNVGAFAVGEISYYPFDPLAFRAAVTVDDIDALATVGAEFAVPRLPVSLFADWTLALNRYRNDQYYNDFSFGIRIASPFNSLQERDRVSQMRALSRPVDPQ